MSITPENPEEPNVGTPAEEAIAPAPAGLATTSLRPAVRLLVEGPATIGELVSVSGVSRRGIEALLAGWQPGASVRTDRSGDATGADVDDSPPDDEEEPDAGGEPSGLSLEDDRWVLVDPLRARLIADWNLEGSDRHGAFADPALRSRLEGWSHSLAAPRRELDHRPATFDGVAARLDLLDRHLDIRGARVLVLGGRDLDALAIAADGRAAEVAAVDVDDAVLGALGTTDLAERSPLLRWCDVRVGLPRSLAGWADLVITDPPYTPEGMAAFLATAADALSGAEGRVAVSYGFGETRATLGWQVQREMMRAAFAICAMWPDVVSYAGAEAIGGRADLYLLAPTGRDGAQGDAAEHLYTQGPAAARSAIEVDAAPLAAAVEEADAQPMGGGAQTIGVRRLIGGDQAPKLRSGAVPVVDLRGDPGAWLPRALLALAAPTAVLVCDVDAVDRSPDPNPRDATGGRGWVSANLSRWWSLKPAARAVEGADLLVASRIDDESPSPTAGPPLVGRGHANPRNVIAEWLTRSPEIDPPPTRREARAAASAHLASLGASVRPGDSLLDLPLDRIAALLADPIPAPASA